MEVQCSAGGGSGGGWAISEFAPPPRIEQSFKKNPCI